VLLQVVLAADVLYDNDMTDALVCFLHVYLQAAAAQRRCSHPDKEHTWNGDGCELQGRGAEDGCLLPSATLSRCLERPTVILAAEKRFIFTRDDAQVRAPAFEHFMQHVRMVTEVQSAQRVQSVENDSSGCCHAECVAGLQAGTQLVGRFVPCSIFDIDRSVIVGIERSSHLVLMEIWLQV
jgi:hypothetical protein